jgi:hypothetical protein
MIRSYSKLPVRVAKEYWEQVREVLVKQHGLSRTQTISAIQDYKQLLLRSEVRDEIYHAPVSETAEGIARGYVKHSVTPAPRRPRQKRRA